MCRKLFLLAFARPATLEHALGCLARLVRVLLGKDAIADRKLECGLTLVVLGVHVVLDKDSFKLLPAREKAEKVKASINDALTSGTLAAGSAEKLAGRLSWTTQFMFYRLGRALLRPIFDQRFSRDGVSSIIIILHSLYWHVFLFYRPDK